MGAARLIIGVGHPDRGDDAAGLAAARRLGGIEMSGEPLDLIAAWEGAGEVVLIDAVVTGAPPGTIHRWDALSTPLARGTLRFSTHAFGVPEAIELARALGRLPRRLSIWGIEAAQFEPGAGLSPEVAAAVEQLSSGGAGDNS
jgi:hydrogenase maturation protease